MNWVGERKVSPQVERLCIVFRKQYLAGPVWWSSSRTIKQMASPNEIKQQPTIIEFFIFILFDGLWSYFINTREFSTPNFSRQKKCKPASRASIVKLVGCEYLLYKIATRMANLNCLLMISRSAFYPVHTSSLHVAQILWLQFGYYAFWGCYNIAVPGWHR